MPGMRNPNTGLKINNPFTPQPQPMFSPTQTGPQQFAGLAVPQAGAAPRSADTLVRSLFNPQIEEIMGRIPPAQMPVVPPPTAPQINQLTQMQDAFAQQAIPLIAQLLGTQQSFMGPEAALRQGLLDLVGGQDNDLLRQLLGVQEQLNRGTRPQSGAFLFEGFS